MQHEKMEQVSVQLPAEMVEWLRTEAARTGRRVSGVIRRLVTTVQHLRNFQSDESVDFIREEMLAELLQQPVEEMFAELRKRHVA
jgi:Arc/MetJ-type ribon-helix-helix transcriptional regulator